MEVNKTQLINQLTTIESQIARPRVIRVLLKLFKHLEWALNKIGLGSKIKTTSTFFGTTLHFPFPASKDIFLWKAKSHDSEIRLAKYMVNTLATGETFIDVGTHIGYFSQLGAVLVGEKGSVISIEASPSSFQYLKKNTAALDQVKIFNKAVAHEKGTMSFQEYGPQFSEFNSLVEEAPFEHLEATKVEVETIPLDSMHFHTSIKLIKIDVEGAEDLVIQGMQGIINQNPGPVIVLEYLKNKNEPHKRATKQLQEAGYRPFRIDRNGALEALADLEIYISSLPFESDNIIFKKSQSS